MKIKLAITAIAFCVSQATLAGTFAPEKSNLDIKEGFGIGTDWATYIGEDFAFQVNYASKKFTAAIGGNYERNRFAATGRSVNWVEWRGHLGLRHQIDNSIFLTAGATGAYSNGTNNPYNLGPYVGMDYYLSSQVFTSFKIMPYSKERRWNGNTANTFFEEGAISLNYTF